MRKVNIAIEDIRINSSIKLIKSKKEMISIKKYPTQQ